MKKCMKKLILTMLILGFLIPQALTDTAEAAGGTWKQDKNGWYYAYSNKTYAKNEWIKSGGKWYYFNEKGYMVTGWKKIGTKWYYFGTGGAMSTGWVKTGGKWYYFGTSGAMATGWVQIGGKWYNFGTDGAMVTGWKQLGGKWYYFNSSGIMQTGTITIGGKKYTFDKNGVWNGKTSGGTVSLANAKVGDYVIFGSYEQDNNTSNGKEKISWKVLAKKDGKLLLISEYGLDTKQYNNVWTEVTWDKCTLRTWLNDDFYGGAFTAAEKQKILTTTVSNSGNPTYKTDGGAATKDKMFLLSMDEVVQYFKLTKENGTWTYATGTATRCKPTKYAIAQNARLGDVNKKYTDYCYWWLRTTGSYLGRAAYVSVDGSLDHSVGGVGAGIGQVYDKFITVRPAMWVKP